MKTEHLDLMLDSALTKACEKLEKNETLYPYVLVMDKNAYVEFNDDFDQAVYESDPEELIEDLFLRLKKRADEEDIYGAGLVCQVKVKHPEYGEYCSAIEAHVEYKDGSAYDCFLPYNKKDDKIEYGEIFSSEIDPKIFSTQK
ncbi:hypothetical protein PQO03_03065 [Lentisphaera profundi]|uniref:DUF600 domain-containing protein n=1 Tax=Lentisphaera profundi TaxID=1658616 RepID=A0ABY7VUQ3_9BACT|nr:hypothetical protein [Lentisphaera profundi]WDE96940.1 hypothetical protein PQO03_03065 [Lentisphaera profundi]